MDNGAASKLIIETSFHQSAAACQTRQTQFLSFSVANEPNEQTMSVRPDQDVPNQKKMEKRAYLGNSQQNNPLSNPCIKEQDLSLKCLDDNNYDKDACELYFVNYNNCRAFWNKVIKERRAQGILPYLPLPHERDEIKRRGFSFDR